MKIAVSYKQLPTSCRIYS